LPLGLYSPDREEEIVPNTDYAAIIAAELAHQPAAVARALALLDEGNTIPFVARYRKEATAGLDEEQLRTLASRAEYLRHLDERKDTVLASIDSQGKLTPELEEQIRAADQLQTVEDLYLPYKPKRRTRATVASERGLEPLAQRILAQDTDEAALLRLGQQHLSDEVPTAEDALAGARDIVAETVAEDAPSRAEARNLALRTGEIVVTRRADAQDPQGTYDAYADYAERLASIPPHRLLAINRGERENVLKVQVNLADDALLAMLAARFRRGIASSLTVHLDLALEDGYRRLLLPAVIRDLRAQRTELAEQHAIAVFAENLRDLLLQPPIHGVRVMGIDPAYRTGCKVAIVDEMGALLEHTTIYPHPPQNRRDEAARRCRELIKAHNVALVAIGNGTASRETEAMAADLIADGAPVQYVMVSEAGASVYSASPLAAAELPTLDVSIRGAVSIARRLQDPLAELVKIPPQSIGVGLYQHDVDQTALSQALDAVVESVVNQVGVDLNTASPALLQHVSGLGASLAESIVAHRGANGPFGSRHELLQVKGLGPKTFQQAAGFLRIRGGGQTLDNTAIHPESYQACAALLERLGVTVSPLVPQDIHAAWQRLSATTKPARVAQELGVGLPTLQDMVENLLKPGRDPRDELPPPILRSDLLTMDDLREGMILKGTVRNVVDFGAFVDIGVKQDGLVHISQMADHFVRDPRDVVRTGQVVQVRILQVDRDRQRIALSLKGVAPA